MIDTIHPCPVLADGKPCVFARADRTCSYAGGSCQTITEHCGGCQHMDTNPRGMKFCTIFFRPDEQWADGVGCLFAPKRRHGARRARGAARKEPAPAGIVPRSRACSSPRRARLAGRA